MTGKFSQKYWDDPTEVDLLREMGPYHWIELPPPLEKVRAVLIVRHPEAMAAMKDERLGNDRDTLLAIMKRQRTRHGLEFVVPAALSTSNMLFTSGLDHARLRRIVAPPFDARVDSVLPRVRQIAADLIDDFGADASVDLVAEFAVPLSMSVIGEVVGIPQEDYLRLATWAAAVANDDSTASATELGEYLTELIDTKRNRRADDLITDLLSHRELGLTTDELMETLILLLVPGHEATAAMIGNSVAYLLGTEHGKQAWRALAEDPSLVPAAVEEMLRLQGPSRHATYRHTLAPMPVGDGIIPAGEIVLVAIGSANRDAQKFPEGAAPCLHRAEIDDHMAFGIGAHHCFGAKLARTIARAAFGELPQRFPSARLAVPEESLVRIGNPLLTGHRAVPAILRP